MFIHSYSHETDFSAIEIITQHITVIHWACDENIETVKKVLTSSSG